MGMTCFMCGLDFKSVKLVQIEVIDDRNGQQKTETSCEHCKAIALANNHPINQNLENPEPQQTGFIKPSNPNNPGYPPVRPQ